MMRPRRASMSHHSQAVESAHEMRQNRIIEPLFNESHFKRSPHLNYYEVSAKLPLEVNTSPSSFQIIVKFAKK